jgi:hypothetical protein
MELSAMSMGKEHLHRIHSALSDFESAVINREKWKPLDSKITRQQDVDHARQKIVDVFVDLVTTERMKQQGPSAQ